MLLSQASGTRSRHRSRSVRSTPIAEERRSCGSGHRFQSTMLGSLNRFPVMFTSRHSRNRITIVPTMCRTQGRSVFIARLVQSTAGNGLNRWRQQGNSTHIHDCRHHQAIISPSCPTRRAGLSGDPAASLFVERCSMFIVPPLRAPGTNNQGVISAVFDIDQCLASPC